MNRHEYRCGGAMDTCLRGNDLPQSRLNPDKVRAIRAQYGPRTARELAETYGVHIRTIEAVVTWRNWRHVR